MDAPGFVLIVEDDELLGPLLVSMLSAQGLVARLCTGPDQVWGLIRGAMAVVCDVHLEDKNGFTLIREIRAAGFAGPIVVISGSGDAAIVNEAAQAGADGFRPKPFSGLTLATMINKLIVSKGQTATG